MKKERRKNRLGSNVESFWITHTERKRKKKAGTGWLTWLHHICMCLQEYIWRRRRGMNDSLFSPTLLVFCFFFCLSEAMDGWMRKEGEI